MIPSIGRLIKMRHYGQLKFLRVISAIHFYITLFLIFIPFWFGSIAKLFSAAFSIPVSDQAIFWLRTITWLLAVLSAANVAREYFLSRAEFVGIDYKREIIRNLLLMVMDTYKWSGTCRATILIPQGDKIVYYDRISSGEGPSDHDRKCFFRMGQGIPGKAWKHAWNGDGFRSLLESIQIGNVPSQVIHNKNSLRKFFREQFDISDDDIYEALGDKKFKIRSYMAVGIFGRFRRLAFVLVIDSEDEDVFADIEVLQRKQEGKMTYETGVFMTGKGDSPLGEIGPTPILRDVTKDLIPEFKNLKSGEWNDTKKFAMKWALVASMIRSSEPNIPLRQFLFPLHWMLKQVRDILIMG